MATSFFDLVRTGGASFDAPGFAAEELTELVHAAMDLLPPSMAADLAAHRPLEHHGPGSSWVDLVAAHDHGVEPWSGGGLVDGAIAHDSFDHDPFDFGAGASQPLTSLHDHVEHRPAFDAHHGPDTADHHGEHGDVGWAHDDLFEHDQGQPHALGHDHPLFSDVAGHDHAGLHDSVLHDHPLHDGEHGPHDLGHDAHDDDPHHEAAWHHE